MPQSFDPRDARAPRSHSARNLGPYETAYDVRRGYDEPGADTPAAPRPAQETAWMGRRRER